MGCEDVCSPLDATTCSTSNGTNTSEESLSPLNEINESFASASCSGDKHSSVRLNAEGRGKSNSQISFDITLTEKSINACQCGDMRMEVDCSLPDSPSSELSDNSNNSNCSDCTSDAVTPLCDDQLTTPSPSLCAHKKLTHKISFDPCVRVVLIPSVKDYQEAGLAHKIWFTPEDLDDFKNDFRMQEEMYLFKI